MPDDTEKLVIDFENNTKVGGRDRFTNMNEPGMEMKGEIWMTTTDHCSSGSRIPFTREEKEFLCELIQKHVYSKLPPQELQQTTQIDANGRRVVSSPFCRVPNSAWEIIEEEFNAEENVRKRSIKQLRKCWENLKHRGKINPEALFSGKRLQGTTSATGGFTLAAVGGDENQEIGIGALSPREDHEISPVTSDTNEDSFTNAPGSSFVEAASTQFEGNQMSKYRAINDIAESIMQRDMQRESTQNEELVTSPPFVTSSVMTSSRPTMVTPKISSIRTVRSLKPTTDPLRRRYSANEKISRLNASRAISNLAMAGKTHAQKIHEMKVKLLAARIREHEANVERVNLQMRQAQAHHDVTMRLLRTKSAWYEANLRQLGMQLQNGDFSLVGEEETEYPQNLSDQEEMNYGEEYP